MKLRPYERILAEVNVLRIASQSNSKRLFSTTNPKDSISQMSDELLMSYILTYTERGKIDIRNVLKTNKGEKHVNNKRKCNGV